MKYKFQMFVVPRVHRHANRGDVLETARDKQQQQQLTNPRAGRVAEKSTRKMKTHRCPCWLLLPDRLGVLCYSNMDTREFLTLLYIYGRV